MFDDVDASTKAQGGEISISRELRAKITRGDLSLPARLASGKANRVDFRFDKRVLGSARVEITRFMMPQ